jgi:hypothetical protein
VSAPEATLGVVCRNCESTDARIQHPHYTGKLGDYLVTVYPGAYCDRCAAAIAERVQREAEIDWRELGKDLRTEHTTPMTCVCPFCGGQVCVGMGGSISDEPDHPVARVLHSEPPCDRYDRLSGIDFLLACQSSGAWFQ